MSIGEGRSEGGGPYSLMSIGEGRGGDGAYSLMSVGPCSLTAVTATRRAYNAYDKVIVTNYLFGKKIHKYIIHIQYKSLCQNMKKLAHLH